MSKVGAKYGLEKDWGSIANALRRQRNGLHRELGAPGPEAAFQRHGIHARVPQPVRHTGAGGLVGSIAINHGQTAAGALRSPLNH